jgi:hypothetical protein
LETCPNTVTLTVNTEIESSRYNLSLRLNFIQRNPYWSRNNVTCLLITTTTITVSKAAFFVNVITFGDAAASRLYRHVVKKIKVPGLPTSRRKIIGHRNKIIAFFDEVIARLIKFSQFKDWTTSQNTEKFNSQHRED